MFSDVLLLKLCDSDSVTTPIGGRVVCHDFTIPFPFKGRFVIRGLELDTTTLLANFNSLLPTHSKIWKTIQDVENGVLWSNY